MTTKTRTRVEKAAEELVSAEAMKRLIEDGTRYVYRMEETVARAEEELTSAREDLEKLGFDVSQPLEPQLQALRDRAALAYENAQHMLSELSEKADA